MARYVFQCDACSTSMDSTTTGRPVSVYSDGMGCHVLCLWHGIPVWQHIGQITTATSRHRRDMTHMFKSNVKPQKTRMITIEFKPKAAQLSSIV